MLVTSLLTIALLQAPASSPGQEVDRLCTRLAAFDFAGSVLVAEGDRVLLHKGFGLADREGGRAIGPHTIFDIGSVTKQFTATAILLLEERGALSTSDSLARFFADVPEEKRAVTLDHLLSHTSGLPPSIPVGSATTERAVFLERVLEAEMTSRPGEAYVYNNVGYLLLAAVIEVKTEVPYEEFVRENLFAPAELRDTNFLSSGRVDDRRTAIGYEGERVHGPAQNGWYSWGLRGAGGVLSTTGDLHRWVRAVQAGKILGREAQEKLFTATGDSGYARGWMLGERGELGWCIYHGGTTRGFEAALETYPDRDLVVVVLCNDRGTCGSTAFRIARVAADLEAPPLPVAEVAPVDLAGRAGRYVTKDGAELLLRVEDRGLTVELDVELLCRLATGASTSKLERRRAPRRLAEVILARLERGDAEALEELVDPRYPNWHHTLRQVWRSWELKHGAYLEGRVIGTNDSSALVVLEYTKRRTLMEMFFAKDRLTRFRLDGGLPESRHFLPASSDLFQLEKVGRSSGEAELRFDGKALVFAVSDRGRAQSIEAVWKAPLEESENQRELTLAELAGEYRVQPRGTLRIEETDSGSLALAFDADALVSFATGWTTDDLEPDRASEKIIREVFASLRAGNVERLARVLSTKWSDWAERLVPVFRDWERSRGQLRKVSFLGTEGDRAFVELVHQKRRTLFAGTILDGRLQGFELDGGLPEERIFPRTGPLEFGYRTEERRPRTTTLTFLLDDRGKPAKLVLVAGGPGWDGGRLTAVR